MNSRKDLEEFFKRYAEHCQSKYPRFVIQPFFEMIQGEMIRGPISRNFHQGGINPIMDPMIDQLNQLRLSKNFININIFIFNLDVQPKMFYPLNKNGPHFPPVQIQNFPITNTIKTNKKPNQNHQSMSRDMEEDEIAYEVYQIVEKIYPV